MNPRLRSSADAEPVDFQRFADSFTGRQTNILPLKKATQFIPGFPVKGLFQKL